MVVLSRVRKMVTCACVFAGGQRLQSQSMWCVARVACAFCRAAAKEYRRRQKDYVRSLEMRIAMMENQNQEMTEELKRLKELYSVKSHLF